MIKPLVHSTFVINQKVKGIELYTVFLRMTSSGEPKTSEVGVRNCPV
jgi:hypothetical protein